MASSRAAKSGIARDNQLKSEAKYDKGVEEQIRQFIEDQIGEKLNPSEIGPKSFAAVLHDGSILIKLINALAPGSVKKTNKGKMPFLLMENINNFLSACEAYGVPSESTFQTVDLFEEQNMYSVQCCLWALASKARSKGVNTTIGVKMSEKNVREFDEETLKQGQAVIGLQMGSNKGATQAGISFGQQRKM